MQNDIKLFEQKKIRSIYEEEKDTWYFSVVDVISILIEKDLKNGQRMILLHLEVHQDNGYMKNKLLHQNKMVKNYQTNTIIITAKITTLNQNLQIL